MLVHPFQKVLSSTQHFQEIAAYCNLFNNHRNKTVVGGNHNVLIYYKNASVPDPEGVVLYNTFKRYIFLYISGQKSFCLCTFHNSGL